MHDDYQLQFTGGGSTTFYFVHTQYTVQDDYVVIMVLPRIQNKKKQFLKEFKERVDIKRSIAKLV